MSQDTEALTTYTATCETCDETAAMTAGSPHTQTELGLFLAGHADCARFSISLGLPVQCAE